MWEALVVLGVGSNTATDFLMFIDEDTSVENYVSYMRYGANNVRVNQCMAAFTNTTSQKAIARFTISRLEDNIFIEGQSVRSNDGISDFVITKTVSSDTMNSFQIKPSVAVAAGHGSSIKLTKIY